MSRFRSLELKSLSISKVNQDDKKDGSEAKFVFLVKSRRVLLLLLSETSLTFV